MHAMTARCPQLLLLLTAHYRYGLCEHAPTVSSLMKSPIVQVVAGSGDERTTYSAHEAVLVKAPEFAKQIEQFTPGGVSAKKHILDRSSALTSRRHARYP